MQCPTCNTTLMMTDRQGIEIDYCPQCRGVWLDRGELDKIIERSQEAPTPNRSPSSERYHDPRYDDERRYSKHKKRKSLLSDLFDF